MNDNKKLDFSYMNVDKFLENVDIPSDIEDDGDYDDLPQFESDNNCKEMQKSKKKKKVEDVSKKKKDKKNKETSKNMTKNTNDSLSDSDTENDIKEHKDALNRLKNVDPEFYEFLEQNDKKLLKFNNDFEDSDTESSENEDNPEEVGQSDKLEVASDESDFENDEEKADDSSSESLTINLKKLKYWETALKKEKIELQLLKDVTQAFNSALLSISNDSSKQIRYIVEGSAVFNGVLQLCILNLEPALKKFLGILAPGHIKSIHKAKKFKKVQSLLRMYLLDIVRLLENVSSNNILSVLLKHLHQLASTLQAFPSITKPILKRLVKLWSGSEETVRILAFLCILKITREQQPAYLNNVLKVMYLAYIQNSKFVSPSTLPNINFMRRSLAEMFSLDLNVAYQHAFLFIRQLAIHLRNAVILKKKESQQAVLNWQYINALRFWVDTLSITNNKPQLQPLIYPLVSIITGVIRLSPTATYFPLRFHCCAMLINLSHQTRTYIPILPFILESLNSNTFLSKNKKLSMRPLKFICILRLSQSQLDENAYRDEVIEQVFALTLEYLAHESFSIAYPDLVVFPLIMLRQYMKKCDNIKYSKKLKELVEKIQENSTFIEKERSNSNLNLKESQKIFGLEKEIKNKGTPLWKYYENYIATSMKKRKREAANTDVINAFDLPKINKKGPMKRKLNEDTVDLFPSSESENELEVPTVLKNKTKKIKKAKIQKSKKIKQFKEEDDEDSVNAVDIVEDFNIEDW